MRFIKQNFDWLLISLILHFGLVAMLTVSLARAKPLRLPPPQIAIEAEVVDQAHIDAALAELRQQEKEQRDKEARIAQEIADRRAAADRKHRQEQMRLEQLEIKRKADAKKRAADKAAADKIAAMAEQKRLADEAETKRKRLEAEAEAEAKRIENIRIAKAHADMMTEIDEEERRQKLVNAGDEALYIRRMQQKIKRNWIPPATMPADMSCTAKVRQLRDGIVVSVEFLACNGDKRVKRSIENAAHKASPLPPPPDPTLFDAHLEVTFRPDQ